MLEHIGNIFVDAGLCWVGDPCYIMGDDSSSRVHNWQDFCTTVFQNGQDKNGWTSPLGLGVGFSISTGYGDGQYPVYIRRMEDGRPAQIIIDFEQ